MKTLALVLLLAALPATAQAPTLSLDTQNYMLLAMVSKTGTRVEMACFPIIQPAVTHK